MHWLNLIPEAPFYTVGDGTLRALTDLLRLFTTNITPTVAPVPATTTPTLLVAPSPRVLASPSHDTVLTSPALSTRVVPVSTQPLPHIVDPEDDDTVPCPAIPARPLQTWPVLNCSRCSSSPHAPYLSSTNHFVIQLRDRYHYARVCQYD